jgi:hypothetical protein
VRAHQPLHAIPADVIDPGTSEREVHLAISVGLEVGLVQRTDRRDQLLVADRPR